MADITFERLSQDDKIDQFTKVMPKKIEDSFMMIVYSNKYQEFYRALMEGVRSPRLTGVPTQNHEDKFMDHLEEKDLYYQKLQESIDFLNWVFYHVYQIDDWMAKDCIWAMYVRLTREGKSFELSGEYDKRSQSEIVAELERKHHRSRATIYRITTKALSMIRWRGNPPGFDIIM